MIEVGKTYNTKELAGALNVAYSTFRNNKDQYLKSLSIAYEYEVEYKGRATLYTITALKEDYQKPERKNAREKSQAVIDDFADQCVQLDSLQTAANIGRIAQMDLPWVKQHSISLLPLSDNTKNEYLRISMREGYGTVIGQGGTRGMIEKKVWCHLDREYNQYIEMPQEMVDKYFECLQEAKKEQIKIDTECYEDYQAGLITREEWLEKNGMNTENLFKNAKTNFRDKYGYWPIKVPVYVLSAWRDESKAYAEVEICGGDRA